jgi:Ca2+-transporting ATPase
VHAIRLGRRTYANLRQAMVYTLAVHVPIVGLSMLPVLFGLPLVLAPLHIAFLELVIDPACSLVFEAEDGDPDLMHQPPRPSGAVLLTTTHVTQSLLQGGLVTAMVVGSMQVCCTSTCQAAWPAPRPSWPWSAPMRR